MRLRTLRKVKESRSRSSRIMDIIRYKQLLKQHYNIVILLYYDLVPPYTIHLCYNNHSPKTHRFPPFSRQENGRISAHKRATDKSGVPKEAQDNGLSAGMSYGRQTPPRRPSGREGDISHAQWDISQQKNGDN